MFIGSQFPGDFPDRVALWHFRKFAILLGAMETAREQSRIPALPPSEMQDFRQGICSAAVTVCHNAPLPHACTVLSLNRKVRHLRILWGRFLQEFREM